MTQIVYNAIRCPDGTVLHSRHRHDYQQHLDTVSGEVYVNDGGNEYIRRSANTVPAIDMTVTMDDPHEVKRKVVTWRTFGKDYEFPEGKIVRVCDMEDDHIRAILETQFHIRGTYIEQLLVDELEWRESILEPALDEFSQWMFDAKSDTIDINGIPAPLLTEILYRICDNDVEKFERVCDMMQSAFKAGKQTKE